MGRIAALTVLAGTLPLVVFGADCKSALDISHYVANGRRHVLVKNISSQPVVAYTAAMSEKTSANGSVTHVFSGVFTGQDSLGAGKTMEIGTAPDTGQAPRIDLDYVRLADHWTCGETVTEQGKQTAKRFQN
jgi:hypothetical protein